MNPLKDKLLDAVEAEFRYYKKIAEDAIGQISWQHMQEAPAGGLNSIAVIMKHMAGNLRSRWTDFLTSDGEKPWRNREQEFINDLAGRDELMGRWEEAWETLFETLRGLREADLEATVTIRTQPVTVSRALVRQVGHYGYHTGQILLIARTFAGPAWRFLSIPPGGSKAFNASMRARPGA
ncbi:MAG: DUF1572 family protein [Planctomycetota bacterium]|nr:DUF1572 family protein [Planctomycetota bacterium]